MLSQQTQNHKKLNGKEGQNVSNILRQRFFPLLIFITVLSLVFSNFLCEEKEGILQVLALLQQ